MSQVINTTAGDVDYVTARVTEQHGKPLDDTTWKLALGGYSEDERPTLWKPADLVEPVSASVVLVSMLVDADTPKGTGRYLWVLPTDAPTIHAYRVSTARIDVI